MVGKDRYLFAFIGTSCNLVLSVVGIGDVRFCHGALNCDIDRTWMFFAAIAEKRIAEKRYYKETNRLQDNTT